MNVLSFYILLTLFVISTCQYPNRPVANSNYKDSKIVKHENNIGLLNYNFSYETSDGTSRQEEAEIKDAGNKNEVLVVRGFYSYVGADGAVYKVSYVADENGYRASGEHLPKNN